MLSIAIRIAAQAFEVKVDKGGIPYILHCLHVMNKVKHLGEDAMAAAVLHDVPEDCSKDGYTFEYLESQGIKRDVIAVVKLLTHDPSEPYMDYIKRLALNEHARAIKKADLQHNSDITRLKGLRKKDFDRLEKYAVAYEYLK